MKKVSIVIPTRNRAHYIERAIKHAFDQDYENLEIIVSNNASEDETDLVLTNLQKKYPHLKTIAHEELLSLNVHWDRVINEYSSGDLLMVIPDDDILIDMAYISKAVAIFEKYNDIGIVFANYADILTDGTIKTSHDTQLNEFVPKEMIFNNYNKNAFNTNGFGIPHLTAVFSRKAYLEVGGFDYDCMSPDTYLWLKILLKYDVGFVREIVANYLLHENNLSKKANIDQFYSDTKIPYKVKEFAIKSNLYSRNIDTTLKRMFSIFYLRYIGVLYPKKSLNRSLQKFKAKFKKFE